MDNFELYYRLNKNNRSKKITDVPPLSFVSNGENLSDCKIYGASGGVGDRTANLYNESAAVDTDCYIKNDGNSAIGGLGDIFLQVRLDVTPSTYYVFSWSENVLGAENNTAYIRISEYKQNGTFIKRALCNCSEQPQNIFSFTTGNNTTYIDLRIDSETSSRGQHLSGIMIVSGNTAPTSYEPYGYKIPIVVAGKNLFDENTVTEDAFLYVNDGTVRKNSSGTANVSGYIPTKKSRKYILTFSAESVPNGFTTVVCYYDTSKQYTQQRNAFATASSSERCFFELVPQNDGYIRVKYPSSAFNLQVEDSDSATDYEPHYESQTAAIYLNEPLAEGESISSRSAGVSIPTINGTTILSVDTAVQPSRIDVALTSKQSKMADSMLKYFSYKYGILK